MRIATHKGRAVMVSSNGAFFVDIAEASDGRFGPGPRAVFDHWTEFEAWASNTSIDIDAKGSPLKLDELGPPSPDPRQIFAIGLNYRDHADESGLEHPVSPPTFTKWLGSFTGPVGDLILPAATVDWEAELVVIIGRLADHVPSRDAWSYVAGLTVGQDYSERALQWSGAAPQQFSLGKSYSGFAPQGPWMVTPNDFTDPGSLAIECRINGEIMQKSQTERMIFSIPDLIERLSAVVPLHAGDVIFTGTPAGIGAVRKPPRFLQDGDVVETTIEGIGTLRQVCLDQ